MDPILLTVVGTVVVALISGGFAYRAQKQATTVQKTQTKIGEAAVILDGYDSIVKNLQAEAERYQELIAASRQEVTQLQALIADSRQEAGLLKEELESLRGRITELESIIERLRQRITDLER